MRILALGPNQKGRYNWGHQLFKDEIARQHDVRFYGEGYDYWKTARRGVVEVITALKFRPDVILTYMAKYCRWVEGMLEVDIPKVHIVIDYFKWNYKVLDEFLAQTDPDLTLAVCRHEVRAIEKRHPGRRVRHFPFSVDIDTFSTNGQKRDVDVTAVFSVVRWAYPTRHKILATLEHLPIESVLQASWPRTRIWHEDYVDLMARSKIVVNGVDTMKSLNWKFLEPCSCGALLLTEEAEDMGKLGFVDGVNCVVFDGMPDLVDKIAYYLREEEERKRIASAGALLVRTEHSARKRVEQLAKLIAWEFNIADS
jgi:glycosyltransferase involved in cell wall biosynthesis